MNASRKKPRRPDFITIPPSADLIAEESRRENEFRDRWKKELERARKTLNSGRGANDFWEGEQAVKELERLGYFQRLLILPVDEETNRLFEMMLREITIYRSLCTRGVEINREFVRLSKFLPKLLSKLREFKAGANITKPVVDQLSAQIREFREQLPQKKEQFWSESLGYSPTELAQPYYDAEALERGEQKIEYIAPESAAELDEAAFNWKIPSTLSKRANLDTRLQIRLAVAFNLWRPDLSWRTTSRLVVLTYICTGLAKEVKDNLLIVSRLEARDAKLTARTVEKKLNKARPDPDADPDAWLLAGIKE